MKNLVIAIRETETRCRYYVVVESDITTGKCYAYNPKIGFKVITPYKDRDPFRTEYIRADPFQWMVDFDVSKVNVPKNWME